MPILLVLLLVAVLVWAWVQRRGSTLTRACRWRLDRAQGPDHWRCVGCGATMVVSAGTIPRQCPRRAEMRPRPGGG